MKLWKAPVDGEDAAAKFDQLLQEELDSLTPILGPSLEFQAELLGVPHETIAWSPPPLGEDFSFRPSARILRAELLTDKSNLYALSLRSEDGYVELDEHKIERRSTTEMILYMYGPSPVDSHVDAIRRRVRGVFGITLEPYSYPDDTFNRLLSEGRKAPAPPHPSGASSCSSVVGQGLPPTRA